MNWRKKFRKLFVEPLNSDIRATNLNNELCVMATAKEMEAFISNLLKEALTEAMGNDNLVKYLLSSKIESFCEEYQNGYKDCIKDIARFQIKNREHVKKVLDKYN